ncbi:MAG: hypothetical protein ACRD9R_05215 [Pyrinomonadaceae bacterium]
MINKLIITLCLTCLLAVGIGAQKKLKSWTEWSKKDSEKILNDSGWGQTQVETDTSELFFQPTAPGGANASQRNTEGATNQAVNVKYRVRFFSARPVRMALARLIELEMKSPNPQASEGLKNFAEVQSPNSIIVTVSFETTDQRYGGRLLQAFNSAETSTTKNNSYLERKDGKRLFLQEYVKPGRDGFGARFIFPRMLDGQPFLTPESGEVRFHGENSGNNLFKADRRFKVSEMMYDGAVEY